MTTDADVDPLAPVRVPVQSRLDTFLAEQREILLEASTDLEPVVDAADTLLRGGKRLRPAFCFWAWHGSAETDADGAAGVVTLGAALELFQAAALVHDDLIDGSDTRRGAPAAHRALEARHRDQGWHGDPAAFGRSAAVLLGDLLLGWSDELYHRAELSAEAGWRARPHFDRMRTEVGAGQYLDILEQASAPVRPTGGIDRARRVIRYKAGRYSVQRPLLLGAAVAGAPDPTTEGLRRLGDLAGEAFQLRDDLLGVFGDPATTGKPAGDDLREGKRTVLVADALAHADPDGAAYLQAHLGDPDATTVPQMQRVIVESGAARRTERRVQELGEQATRTLDGLTLGANAHAALTVLLDRALQREA